MPLYSGLYQHLLVEAINIRFFCLLCLESSMRPFNSGKGVQQTQSLDFTLR